LLIVITGVVAIVVGTVGWVYGVTTYGARKTYALNPVVPPIPTDSASIERGRHLAHAVATCAFCHGERLEGKVYFDEPAVGRLVPSNLTAGRGGIGASMRDVDWVNAIRHGVGPDRRTLIMMPSEVYQAMTSEDLGALIAYLERLPPVDNVLPESRLGPVGRMLQATDRAPLFTAEHVDHDREPPAPVERGVSVRYGYYLARLGGCIGCHGNDLAGRRVPGAPAEIPPAANLTRGGIGDYTEADFIRALREGRRPDGSPINPFMPLTATKELTEEEMRAIFAYLRSLPPREFGQNTSPRSVPPAG
jgi:cytochrome c553